MRRLGVGWLNAASMPASDAEVLWSPAAEDDLLAIVDHVLEEPPVAARAILARLEAAAASLGRMSARGRVVPELRALGIHEYRELLIAPYRLVFRTGDRSVGVFMVIHARRDIEAQLL